MLEKLIKRCDMFSIIQFTRYNGQKSYRTITGGIVSILLYGSLLTIFIGLLMETLNYTNISVTSQDINFELNPSYYELGTNRANRFMFAVGITGRNIDLNSFDVVLQNHATTNKTNETYFQTILMKPCNLSDWVGINQEITQSFHGHNLGAYLCPPAQYILELQGKPTSEVFKYTMISVAECGKYNPNADCPNNIHLREKQFDLNQKLNFFYINSQVNPKNKEAVSYYIEDVNIFNLDLRSSFTANIFFSQYEITTDKSLMPWSQNQVQRGIFTKGEATTQSHTLRDNVYARILLRKSSQKLIVQRSFEKITKPISYIGGLSNPILMVLSVLRMYTIYAYEIQFGGKIFKQATDSSFDSQRFNFITYVKCRIYNIFKNFSFCKDWASIKDYYQCRKQSIKQLDVHLLHKKMIYFQEVCNLLLEKHYQIGLHLLPKRSIEVSEMARLKYFYQTSIQKEQKQSSHLRKLSTQTSNLIQIDKMSERKKAKYQKQLQLQRQFSSCYHKLKFDSQTGDHKAQEILTKIKGTNQCQKLQKIGIEVQQFSSIQNGNMTILSQLVETETEQKGNDSISKSP